jgi:hypothetical protein
VTRLCQYFDFSTTAFFNLSQSASKVGLNLPKHVLGYMQGDQIGRISPIGRIFANLAMDQIFVLLFSAEKVVYSI